MFEYGPRIERMCQFSTDTPYGRICGGSLLARYKDINGRLLVSNMPEKAKCFKQLSIRERRNLRGKKEEIEHTT